jgi:hypothetical protein
MRQAIPKAAAVGTPYLYIQAQCSYPLSEGNSLVLSEFLKDEAVRILVDEVISNTFPKQCDEWRSATTDTRKSVREEMIKTQEEACQDIISQETFLRRALLDAVVDDVVKLFPCVLSELCGHGTAR